MGQQAQPDSRWRRSVTRWPTIDDVKIPSLYGLLVIQEALVKLVAIIRLQGVQYIGFSESGIDQEGRKKTERKLSLVRIIKKKQKKTTSGDESVRTCILILFCFEYATFLLDSCTPLHSIPGTPFRPWTKSTCCVLRLPCKQSTFDCVLVYFIYGAAQIDCFPAILVQVIFPQRCHYRWSSEQVTEVLAFEIIQVKIWTYNELLFW